MDYPFHSARTTRLCMVQNARSRQRNFGTARFRSACRNLEYHRRSHLFFSHQSSTGRNQVVLACFAVCRRLHCGLSHTHLSPRMAVHSLKTTSIRNRYWLLLSKIWPQRQNCTVKLCSVIRTSGSYQWRSLLWLGLSAALYSFSTFETRQRIQNQNNL